MFKQSRDKLKKVQIQQNMAFSIQHNSDFNSQVVYQIHKDLDLSVIKDIHNSSIAQYIH